MLDPGNINVQPHLPGYLPDRPDAEHGMPLFLITDLEPEPDQSAVPEQAQRLFQHRLDHHAGRRIDGDQIERFL